MSRKGFIDALAAAKLPVFRVDVNGVNETVSAATPVTQERKVQ